MIRQTIAGLTALVASVVAVQSTTQTEASQWYGGSSRRVGNSYGYGGYNSNFGYNPFGYDNHHLDSKVQRLQRDVSYLVKQNSALKTRIEALEANGGGSGGGGGDNSALEARVAALEAKTATNMMSIQENDQDISALDVRVSDNEGDITVLDMMVCDNMMSIGANTTKIAANMMSISANSAAIGTGGGAIDPAVLAMISADIAANTAKIGTNMMTAMDAQNAANTNSAAIAMISNGLDAISMISTNPAFLANLEAAISTNSNNIATGSNERNANTAKIAANMMSIMANSDAVSPLAAKVTANMMSIATNSAGVVANKQGNEDVMSSLGFITFQVVDNLTSNIVQDSRIDANSAAIAAL